MLEAILYYLERISEHFDIDIDGDDDDLSDIEEEVEDEVEEIEISLPPNNVNYGINPNETPEEKAFRLLTEKNTKKNTKTI